MGTGLLDPHHDSVGPGAAGPWSEVEVVTPQSTGGVNSGTGLYVEEFPVIVIVVVFGTAE